MEEVRFIDYIKHRIEKERKKKRSPFGDMLKDLTGLIAEIEGQGVIKGQYVLDRILFRYRHDITKRNQVSILVNAYRSYCKGGKQKETISIRDATALAYY